MSLSTDSGTGLETIGRAAFMILYNELNTRISEQALMWDDQDRELAEMLGREWKPADVQPIPDANWHFGIRQSLIEAPAHMLPNISGMAYAASEAAQSQDADQYDFHNVQLYVEAMVIGSDEDVVNRRAQRTADAIVRTLRAHRTLDGTVIEIGPVPTILISDIFARRESSGGGERLWWQGARIEWNIIRPSTNY